MEIFTIQIFVWISIHSNPKEFAACWFFGRIKVLENLKCQKPCFLSLVSSQIHFSSQIHWSRVRYIVPIGRDWFREVEFLFPRCPGGAALDLVGWLGSRSINYEILNMLHITFKYHQSSGNQIINHTIIKWQILNQGIRISHGRFASAAQVSDHWKNHKY